MPSIDTDVIVISSSSSDSRPSSPIPRMKVSKMNTRTSQAIIVDDEEMPRSSAASRVSLANLLGPSGPGSSPYANSPRTSPRKRSSAGESGSNLQPPTETVNGSNGAERRDGRRSDVSSPQQPTVLESEQAFHDAEEHVPDDVPMADATEENVHVIDDDEEDDDDDDDDDEDDDKATTDAGSASEGEGDGEGEDKGEGSSSKDGAKPGETASAPKKRSRRRSPSPPEAVAPPAPKRPTVRINILEARQSGYLINVPELVLVQLKDKHHPWAKWYEEQLLEAAEPEPVAPPSGAPDAPPGLEGFGGLAKLLAKYPTGEGSGAPSGAGGASNKRRRPNDDKYDIGQYDVRDPFVDDSELNIDEPTHFAKPKADGFYVTKGTVELAKAKASAQGQPIPAKDRPKPLSIRDSKFGFADSLAKLVARKAQKVFGLPPMPPPTASPSMQLGSLLNSGDPGSPSVSAASALTNTQRQEGTRDSPIKVDDNDSGSSKVSKKNRYPTLPVDPRLQAAFNDLKQKVDAESFAVKTKFPPALKPPLVETAKLAVMLQEYDDNFFNHLPTIFPYNRFTMMKLVKREFFPVHNKLFEDLKQDHLNKLGAMIRDSYPQQLADFEAAHKAWMERGEAPKDGEGADANKQPKNANGADDGMDVDGPKDEEDENVEPAKRWKWTEEMREQVFLLITIENAMSEIRNEKYGLESSAEQYSEINARKACYKQMFELFPEEGWTTSTNISREYAQIKKKKDRQEARGEDLFAFADSRAGSVGPA